ncbi:ribosomal protein L6 [Basidiobolus meristosporus CBS 931.73]|uniref:Large ribosomal subunit protein uL6m n=1 Tax=Basidiobolus meristosporus CBS 931.73 TaxID=1314790 RepID=A0A1Y1YCV2_9FUNG|nr:ribosomal protein L6 [Basidiobolus meristosporus CBS 931.73]|eukprot:ORX95850.1 ribosomal protein L6 [Basidiobolus meristosporus CBS 931.73]
MFSVLRQSSGSLSAIKCAHSMSVRHFVAPSYPLFSHIGKAPVKYSSEVQIELLPTPFTDEARYQKTRTLTVKGPLGQHSMPIDPFISLKFKKDLTSDDGGQLLEVAIEDKSIKKQKQMWGTTRALINNSVIGVSEGFSVPLRLVGVGYRAALESNGKLGLKLGYSHPIEMEIPEGITVTIPNPTRIVLFGTNNQQVKQFAAKIRDWRKPEPYNQKGIFVGDETIKKKEGKKK